MGSIGAEVQDGWELHVRLEVGVRSIQWWGEWQGKCKWGHRIISKLSNYTRFRISLLETPCYSGWRGRLRLLFGGSHSWIVSGSRAWTGWYHTSTMNHSTETGQYLKYLLADWFLVRVRAIKFVWNNDGKWGDREDITFELKQKSVTPYFPDLLARGGFLRDMELHSLMRIVSPGPVRHFQCAPWMNESSCCRLRQREPKSLCWRLDEPWHLLAKSWQKGEFIETSVKAWGLRLKTCGWKGGSPSYRCICKLVRRAPEGEESLREKGLHKVKRRRYLVTWTKVTCIDQKAVTLAVTRIYIYICEMWK